MNSVIPGVVLLWALPLLSPRRFRELGRYGQRVWREYGYTASPDLSFFTAQRAKFLPISITHTLETLQNLFQLPPTDQERFRTFCHLCRMVIHHEYHETLLAIEDDYAAFDPDSDRVAETAELSAQQRRLRADRFCSQVERILDGGNYIRLSPEQIQACLEAKTRLGLVVRVDPQTSRNATVWYRGLRTETIPQKGWFVRWRRVREVTVRHLLRVAVLIRSTESTPESTPESTVEATEGATVETVGTAVERTEPIFRKFTRPSSPPPTRGVLRLKLFKDLPVEDLKIISPDPKLKMTPPDLLKAGCSLGGVVVSSAIKLLKVVFLPFWMWLPFLFGFAAGLIRVVTSFFTSHTRYMERLTKRLYYQNLSNNLGAVTQLLDEAERQEVLEMVLAYAFLHFHESQRPNLLTLKELDQTIEKWVTEQFGIEVDFDEQDALRKLKEKGLVREVTNRGPTQYQAVPLPTALEKLDEWWDSLYDFHETEAKIGAETEAGTGAETGAETEYGRNV